MIAKNLNLGVLPYECLFLSLSLWQHLSELENVGLLENIWESDLVNQRKGESIYNAQELPSITGKEVPWFDIKIRLAVVELQKYKHVI